MTRKAILIIAAFALGAAALTPATSADTSVPPPSNEFSLGKLNNNPKKGTALAPVFVPGPGTLSARAQRALIKPANLSAGIAGKVLVPLIPTFAGRKVLKKKGRFAVKVVVTFTPAGGTPASKTFLPVLKLDRRSPSRLP